MCNCRGRRRKAGSPGCAVYAALAGVHIGYAYDAPSDEAGRQVIRPPDQVLWAPRHATCLDLATVLAAACLEAGLHPIILLLDPTGDQEAGHALVLVRLDRDTQPRTAGSPGEDVWPAPPGGLLETLQQDLDGAPGDLVAIDPVGLGRSLGTAPTRGLAVDLPDAVANGTAYLVGDGTRAAWSWRVAVDIGSAWRAQDTLGSSQHSEDEPLRAPYRDPGTAETPLRLLRAEYEVVPFQNRDELTILRDRCRQVASGDRTGLAVIHGVGGAGKTRLALELAKRLRIDGWYAGVLPKDPAGVDWLGEVVSPVAVVLDYADGRVADATALLKALRRRCDASRGRPPAIVVLTARSVDGQWLTDITDGLVDDRHPYRREEIRLPDGHPRADDVYVRTVTALRTPTDRQATPISLPLPASATRWTTLDFVLLGWIAAAGATDLPTTRASLYDEGLGHEESYWQTIYRGIAKHAEPERALLRQAAACLSLIAPPEDRADHILVAVNSLAEDPTERRAVRRTLVTCLSPAAGEGLAVRPDPVGDHLLLRELRRDGALLHRSIALAGDTGIDQAIVVLARAGQQDSEAAAHLLRLLLEADPARWPAVLSVAMAQGGVALTVLERLAARPDTPLPLDDISEAIPFSALGLFDLALAVDRRRLDLARAAGAEPPELVELLERVSERARHAGDRAGALASITEAVEIRRRLAEADPAAFLPDLAGSLNNLSARRSDTGDRAGALASITEAVGHYRRLTEADPAAFLPDLAGSLNNLSVRRSDTGDRGPGRRARLDHRGRRDSPPAGRG